MDGWIGLVKWISKQYITQCVGHILLYYSSSNNINNDNNTATTIVQGLICLLM